MTKIDISSDTLTYLNIYANLNNLNLGDIPIDSIINILNIHGIPYTLTHCDENKEVCLVYNQDMIFGNIINSDKECCVCLEDFRIKNKIVRLCCKHILHRECLFETIKFRNSCPMCRKHIQVFLR